MARHKRQCRLFGPYPSAKTVRLLLRKFAAFSLIAPAEFYLKNPAFIIRSIFAALVLIKTKIQPFYRRQIGQLKNCEAKRALIKEYDQKMRGRQKKENFEKAAQFKEIKEKLIWLTEKRTAGNLVGGNFPRRNRLPTSQAL